MKIYWDIVNEEFVGGLDSTQVITEIAARLRDQIPVTLYLVQPVDSSTAYYELTDPPAGWVPIFGAKQSSALSGGHLVYQSTWTKSGTGTYEGTISLNTAELIAAIAAATEIELVGEFTLGDVDENNRNSTQFTFAIDADVSQGGEPSATGVYLGNSALVRQETIGGLKYIILYNSDGVEYLRIPPPGA